MGDLLTEIFRKLGAIEDPARKAADTITLLGRGGLELLPLTSAFGELSEKIKQTGVIMSEEGVKQAEAYRKSLALLGQQWDALKLQMGQGAIGIITLVAGGVKKANDLMSIPGMVGRCLPDYFET